MTFIWCWILCANVDICGPLQKAGEGHAFKLDNDVQEDVVPWFPQQSKEFFADGVSQNMHLNHPWSDSPFQPVTDVKTCTNFTVRGHENMECAETMISTLWNVMKGYTVLGDSEVGMLQVSTWIKLARTSLNLSCWSGNSKECILGEWSHACPEPEALTFLCKYVKTYWLLAATANYIWRFLLPGLYTQEQILSHLNRYSNSIITTVLLRLLNLASLICLFIDTYMFSH